MTCSNHYNRWTAWLSGSAIELRPTSPCLKSTTFCVELCLIWRKKAYKPSLLTHTNYPINYRGFSPKSRSTDRKRIFSETFSARFLDQIDIELSSLDETETRSMNRLFQSTRDLRKLYQRRNGLYLKSATQNLLLRATIHCDKFRFGSVHLEAFTLYINYANLDNDSIRDVYRFSDAFS